MAARRRHPRPRDRIDAPRANEPSRTSFRLEYWPNLGDLRRSLGRGEASQIVAMIEEFFREWQSGVPDSELNRGPWNFKDMQGAPAKSAKLKQIDIGRNYRALLTIINIGDPRCWVLEVFRKTGQKNPQEVERAIGRSRTLWQQAEEAQRGW